MTYFSYFRKKEYVLDDDYEKKLVDLSAYTTIFSRIADDISFYSYYTMQDGERLDTISQKLYGTPEYYWTIPLINSDLINTYRNLPKNSDAFMEYLSLKYPGIALRFQGGQVIAGKLIIGETIHIKTSSTNKARVLSKHPTNGYVQVEVTNGSFPMNQVYTIVGEDSEDELIVVNHTPAYEAPAYYVDDNDNVVRWNSGELAKPVSIREIEIDQNIVSSQVKVIRPRYIYEVVKQFESEMRKR